MAPARSILRALLVLLLFLVAAERARPASLTPAGAAP
jgi:hypothetical protein